MSRGHAVSSVISVMPRGHAVSSVMPIISRRQAVAWMIEDLYYKPEGRVVESR
jgi:hypothetical protein